MALEGQNFVINPDNGSLTSLHIELAENVVEAYNLTGRPAFHTGECVWIRYRAAPDLLEDLLKARTLNPEQKERLNFTRQTRDCEDEATFVCGTYWQSRVLGRKSEQSGLVVPMAMPFVDYLDHHYAGSPYGTPRTDADEPVLSIRNHRPFPSASTLYACYGMYDALDTFITYGFIDTEAPIVRAVPMTIDLGQGKSLEVGAMTAAKISAPLNAYLKDLQAYSPMVTFDDKKKLNVSHLLIPVINAPHALRRILRSLVHTAFSEDEKSPQYIVDLTYRTEREIVENTIAFYKTTLTRIQSREEAPEDLVTDAARLCKIQLAKLYKYFYNENFFTTQQ